MPSLCCRAEAAICSPASAASLIVPASATIVSPARSASPTPCSTVRLPCSVALTAVAVAWLISERIARTWLGACFDCSERLRTSCATTVNPLAPRRRHERGSVRAVSERPSSVAAHVVAVLASAGVRRFYTVPGESFLALLDEVERDPELTLVSTRHESGAAFMAAAEGKLTGTPAVAMASRGPGAANLAIGVHTAREESTPMVVLLGQVESWLLGREAFQEVDLAAFYRPIAKWAVNATRAEEVPALVARGLRIATSGRPGPVAIAVPGDFFAVEVERDRVPALASGDDLARPPAAPDPAAVAQLAELLARARRPVVIAGGGAHCARDELIAVAERFELGVYAGFRRQDVFPNDHPRFLGHLALGTPEPVLAALADADLVVALGTRLGEVTTQSYAYPRPGVPLVHVDVEPGSIGLLAPTRLGIVADTRATLAALLGLAPPASAARDWSAARRAYVAASAPPQAPAAGALHPAEVVAELQRALPPDTLLTSDAGNFAGFLHRYWRHTHPRTQLAPANGAMGYGVPAAVAAKLAAPERAVVAIAGDGGALMTGQEIETAVRHGLEILVVVFQNGLYGTIAMHQALEFGRTAAVEIAPLDLATWATGLGARGFTVADRDELADTVAAAVSSAGPTLLDVRTDPDAISPGRRLSELVRAHPGSR